MSDFDYPMTLKELSNKYAIKQPKMVDFLTEENPILDMVKFEKASHGLWNVYEQNTEIKGAEFVDMNAPLPQVQVDSELKKENLSIIAGELFIPEDKSQLMGGKAAYLAKKTPAILRDAGNATEKHFINNIRLGALQAGNVSDAGSTAATNYSILVVRWIPGENCGLYSPEGFKSGAMLDVTPLWGGALGKNDTGVPGYSVRYKAYFGLQLANTKALSAIVNINSSNKPTAGMLDKALIDARAHESTTFLYMHPACKNLLNSFKESKLQTSVMDKNYSRTFDMWDGIKIVTSYNFDKGTEKKFTV